MARARIADQAETGAAARTRCCEHPGCINAGDFRAPRSRANLDAFYWFCLEHVRAYNATWNYYAGMSAAEVEAQIRSDTVWQRPTWPMGSRVHLRYGPHIRDFGMFDLDEDGHEKREQTRRPLSREEQALAIFELQPPFTLVGLKARYKELVKRHHPDVHGGDKEAEERLKIINLAYADLKASYFPA
jgi:DnaJ domain